MAGKAKPTTRQTRASAPLAPAWVEACAASSEVDHAEEVLADRRAALAEALGEAPRAPVTGTSIADLPLQKFVSEGSAGRYERPSHLAPMTDLFEEAATRSVLACVAAPVQHGKTTTIEFAIAWLLLRHPSWPIIYLTYDQTKAGKHSRRIREIYLANGGVIKEDFNTIKQWETPQGGGLLGISRDGSITGNPAALVVFDDPYKNRPEAEDAKINDDLREKFSGEIKTRIRPGGSIVIVASRWSDEDLSGVKIGEGYREVCLPAISTDDHGEEHALCPWGPDPQYPRTLEWLRSIRDSPDMMAHDWWSLYMGKPRPRGSGVFHGFLPYSRLPIIVRTVVGIDLAFSSGAAGDRCAIVVLGLGVDGVVYVLHVQSWRMGITEAELPIRRALVPFTGAPIVAYASGIELSSYQTLAQRPLSSDLPALAVHCLPARLSKYVRAQKTAARWNGDAERAIPRGIAVDPGAPWFVDFHRLVTGFTGAEGRRDDEVDAFVAAHDVLMGASVSMVPAGGFLHGRRRM